MAKTFPKELETLHRLSGVDCGLLKGCSKSHPGIYGSNLDVLEERNGYFLAVEVKCPDERPPSTGQMLTLERLANQHRWTVLLVIVSGARTSVEAVWLDPIRYFVIPSKSEISCDREDYIRRRDNWFRAADAGDGAAARAAFIAPAATVPTNGASADGFCTFMDNFGRRCFLLPSHSGAHELDTVVSADIFSVENI